MATPRTRTPKPPRLRPIAQKVRAALREVRHRKVVDLGAVRAGLAAAATLQETVPKKDDLAGLHPAHAPYIYVVNQVSVLAEILTNLPDIAESRPHSPTYDPFFKFPGEPSRRP